MTPQTESFLTPLGLRWMRESFDPFGKTEWSLLLVGSAVCVLVCLGVAGAFGVPHEIGFSGSLLNGFGPVSSLAGTIVAILITAIPALVFGTVLGVEGALFCLGVAVAGLAAKAGGVRAVMQYSTDGRPLFGMAIELLLLAATVYAASTAVVWGSLFLRKPTKAVDEHSVNVGPKTIPWNSIVVQIVVTAAAAIVLMQTDQPRQSIGGLSVAVIVGVLAAYLSSDVTEGKWYWFTTPAVGLIGYVLAALSSSRTPTGDLTGIFGTLSRATPLAYAGVGLAAGVFGRWVARRWGQEDEPTDAVPADAADAGVLTKAKAVTPPPPSTL